MAQNLVSPVSSPFHSSNPVSSFPIIAIGVIGICATSFLLITYYIFVIKCCLNWHRIEFLRRFSLSGRREEPLILQSPVEIRGLDPSVIRSIPLIQYQKPTDENEIRSVNCECAICLSEFEEEEQLKKLPNCSHFFHIDCIDIWLQNNSNCPICRTSISFHHRHHNPATPNPSPIDSTPFSDNLNSTADEDFVVIEIDNNRERLRSTEIPISSKHVSKYGRKLEKKTSMGDEFIDMRNKDEEFSIQAIRRSFSMDSSADRDLYLAIKEAVQKRGGSDVSPFEGSSRVRRSFFSFGHGGRISRNAVSPIYFEP